jgi:hypothetical protein
MFWQTTFSLTEETPVNTYFFKNCPNYCEIRIITDRLLCEKISLAGICRATGVSEAWLQNYVNKKYESVSEQVNVSDKKKADSPCNAMKYGLS